MQPSRLFAYAVLAMMCLGWGMVSKSQAAGVDVVVCYDGAVPSTPQTCPSGSVRLDTVSIKSDFTTTTTTGVSGRIEASPLSIVKHLDSASPILFKALVTGSHVQTVGIGIFEGSHRVFSIALSNVLVSRITDVAEDSARGLRSTAALETVEFTFTKIELRDDATGQQAGFDFELGRAL